MKYGNPSLSLLSLLVLASTALTAYAGIKVNQLPEPPATAKLRVYVEAFTLGPAARHWGTPHTEYAKNQIKRTAKFLEQTGIYEVVSEADVQAVTGGQMLHYDSMKSSGWANARTIGRALHADFVLVAARDKNNIGTGEWEFVFITELVNVETGAAYRSRISIGNIIRADHKLAVKLMREAYRDLFNQAKHDMMAVAVRKGRAYGPSTAPAPAKEAGAAVVGKAEQPSVIAEPAKPVVQQAAPKKQPQPQPSAPSVKRVPAPEPAEAELALAGVIAEPKREAGAKKLVVYDLESSDQYRTVALILAEALREEVFKLKQYILINREDLQKVLEEMALQQTGLIDEKEAVRTGKGLAASQVVTGRLGQLGKTFMIQAKRTDVESIATLGIASLKYTEGQEEEALNRLPDFAKSLVGLK